MKKMIATALLLVCIQVTAFAQTIDFNLSAANCESKFIPATSGVAFLTASADGINDEMIVWGTDPGRLAPRLHGKNSTTGWNIGGYWQVEFSTEGLSGLTFSADMFSSDNGPKDFKLQYSIDGRTFTDIPGSTITMTTENRMVYSSFALPAEIENQETAYLRIAVASSSSIIGGNIIGIKDGSSYINRISIRSQAGGQVSPGGDETPPEQLFEKKTNKAKENWGMKTGKYNITVTE